MTFDCIVCAAPGAQLVSKHDKNACCTECMKQWIATQVQDHWHQAVVIKTPCGSRLPLAKWSKIADASVVAQYERVAWSQLMVRCPWCDETKLCMDVPTVSGTTALRVDQARNKLELLGGDTLNRRITRASKRFMTQTITADELITRICVPLQTDLQQSDGAQAHELLKPTIEAIAGAIPDIERRATLMLTFLRKYPFMTTLCCSCPVCFKCQTESHHEGTTCAQNMDNYADDFSGARLCSGCNAAIMRSEGCDHIVCPCGHEFDWGDADELTGGTQEASAAVPEELTGAAEVETDAAQVEEMTATAAHETEQQWVHTEDAMQTAGDGALAGAAALMAEAEAGEEGEDVAEAEAHGGGSAVSTAGGRVMGVVRQVTGWLWRGRSATIDVQAGDRSSSAAGQESRVPPASDTPAVQFDPTLLAADAPKRLALYRSVSLPVRLEVVPDSSIQGSLTAATPLDVR